MEVRFTQTAHGQLTNLPRETQERVKDKLRDVRDDPFRYLERLRGYDHYKLRVGDYRVLIDIDTEDEVIWAWAVGHRSTVYDRNLPP